MPNARPRRRSGSPHRWKLEDAKARFSELVRCARSEGPQHVTCRGQEAVVVVSAEEFDRLAGSRKPEQSLLEFLQGTSLSELEPRREDDRGRNIPL